MKHGKGKSAIYTCDFCGASSRGQSSLFLSPLDRSTAICNCCVGNVPKSFGRVVVVLRRPAEAAAVPQPAGG